VADNPLGGDAPGGHGYGLGWIKWFVDLVLRAGVSLRGASRVLKLLATLLGAGNDVPHWTTGRSWLQRLGHAKLTCRLKQAEDWAWLIDHSVQIGQEKCLVILGVRLANLPAAGHSLQHADLELIALVPRKSWTRKEVDEALEAAVSRTGVPRVIVNDHGVDLTGGVRLFQERHPQTVEIYDIKHQAACLLKRRLEKDPKWQEFQRQVGSTRCAIQQTELAFLVPTAPKTKSRFMNLQNQLRWATHVLNILDHPSPAVPPDVTRQRLQEKLGWLAMFREEIRQWAAWQQVVDTAVVFVNQQGLYRGAAKDLRKLLPARYDHATTKDLAKELLRFVAAESRKARDGERLPGSTEVLESCFGKFKVLERDQSRGGFTSLVLAFGALLTNTTHHTIQTALRLSPAKSIASWCRDNLGPTLFSKRKLAFQTGATQTG
jgi:hypothetical protein